MRMRKTGLPPPPDSEPEKTKRYTNIHTNANIFRFFTEI